MRNVARRVFEHARQFYWGYAGTGGTVRFPQDRQSGVTNDVSNSPAICSKSEYELVRQLIFNSTVLIPPLTALARTS